MELVEGWASKNVTRHKDDGKQFIIQRTHDLIFLEMKKC